jgi:two-component system, OmpR family, sensor kinase
VTDAAATKYFARLMVPLMRQPQSIRFHLAAVFLLFFSLVAVLGMFSIWRLSNFNLLSADVAQIWLPTTRALGDLNNFTSDFRAIEGSNLLSADPARTAATEKDMADLDRTIAAAERSFEHIRHDEAVENLYLQFKERWTGYRVIVNEILELSRIGRKPDALAIYNGSSRIAYNAASDTLGQLTDRAVVDAQVASDRLGVAYRQAVWLISVVMLIAGIMVVAALIHISRSISDPLLDLADRMRRLATNDTEIEIPETERQDEIGEMARATVVFRNNGVELVRSQRTLARQAAMLEEQLANEQRLAELQRNFVSMASHEFRTPMTVIDGHARRLAKVKESVRPAEIGERAGKIRSAVLRMTHLIENLLDSSRLIDAGAGVYFRPAEMDLVSLLDEVCQLHREMVPSAQITERSAAKAIPMVGDSKLLFQVFSNIVSNAIKYSPGGGEIEVSVEVFGKEVMVAIADHGIGIPVSDLDRLFERYHRGGNVSGIVGTGVGLHLVKMVVDLHDGRVVVNSQEGEGSCFTIHLPINDASSIKVWPPAELESVPAAGATPSISEPPNTSQPNSSQKVLSEMSERPER